MRKNKNNTTLIVLIAVIAVLGLFLIYTLRPSCKEIIWLNASVNIAEAKLGVNTDTDSLDFGSLSPGSSAEKIVFVSNNKYSDATVAYFGNISAWLTATPNRFTLENNSNRKLVVDLKIPNDASEGTYSGKIAFCFN